jgi:hypothetical protein
VAAARLEVGIIMTGKRVAVASLAALMSSFGVFVAQAAAVADDEVSFDLETVEEIIISEPFFDAPRVVSPQPDELAMVVQGPEGQWFWILEVTNSDYQPRVNANDGFVGFETLPSVGVFDSVEDRLAWTNQTFACFVGTSCDEPARTADQQAFGDDFVRLPKLYDELSGRVAYHAEHAYNVAKDPYEWVVGQETLHLAIPLAQTPPGVIDIWVGYTYVYTDDMVGVPVRFTEDAMAVTAVTVAIPPIPDGDGVSVGDAAGPEEETGESGGVPLWVVQALLGIVGILVFFGLIALIVSRMVAITRQNK